MSEKWRRVTEIDRPNGSYGYYATSKNGKCCNSIILLFARAFKKKYNLNERTNIGWVEKKICQLCIISFAMDK